MSEKLGTWGSNGQKFDDSRITLGVFRRMDDNMMTSAGAHDHAVTDDLVIENNNAFLMAMGEGSRIEIHAADREKESWTNLETTAEAGSNQIVVQDSTGWEVGDKIAISSTSVNYDEYEEFTIESISADGKTITLDGTIDKTKLGETQDYDNGLSGADKLEWEAEIRAEVALLSRNVTIQGDEDSVEDGFGAHTMVHDGAEQHISGVEYFRVGQEDILGRYPIHWHMLGDAEGQYVKNVSVHDSYQKGVTIHGTSSVMVEDSAVFNHVGHGIFFEDGSENNNLIIGNLVFGTHASESGEPIITDKTDVASYWIENANNVFYANVAGGSAANGFMIFPENEIHGDSVDTFVGEMGSMADLIFQHNVAHSNVNFGLSVEGGIDGETLEINNGGVQDGQYATIDNFLAYENKRFGAWIFTDDLIIEDSMFIGNNFGGLMSKGEAFVENTLFADGTVGTYLYTQGATRLDGVHYQDLDGDVFIHSGISTDGGAAFQNVTSDKGFLDTDFDARSGALGNTRYIIDVDGSITGKPGATITTNAADNALDIAPGAEYDPDLDAWVSEATIGTFSLRASDSDLRVVRSDGEVEDDYAKTLGRDFHVKTATGMESEVAYLLDFSDTPTGTLRATLNNVQEGDSAVFQIANIASASVRSAAEEVFSFEDLLASDISAYFYAEDSLFLRPVAISANEDQPVDDIRGGYDGSFQFLLRNVDLVDNPNNNPSLSSDLLRAIDRQATNDVDLSTTVAEATQASLNDTFELERYESTSDTTVVTDDMARWSDEAAWGGPAPSASDIAVIGPGQTVVLNESILVKGIIVNGGELIIEDDANLNIELSTDYLLVINGGLFQAGTESDPLDTDFTLTLEGDDPDFDLEVGQILAGNVANTVFADVEMMADGGDDHDTDHDMADDGQDDDAADDDDHDTDDGHHMDDDHDMADGDGDMSDDTHDGDMPDDGSYMDDDDDMADDGHDTGHVMVEKTPSETLSLDTEAVEIAPLTLTGDFTISAWVNLQADQVVSSSDAIIGTGTSLANGQNLNFHNGKFRLYSGYEERDVVIAETEAVAGDWAHYSVVRDGDTTSIYINGLLDATGTGWTGDFTLDKIGAGAGAAGFSGQIDDLAIWDRALSEMETLASIESPGAVDDQAGLLRNYDFEVVDDVPDTGSQDDGDTPTDDSDSGVEEPVVDDGGEVSSPMPQVGENLIVNGDFESAPALARGDDERSWDWFSEIEGWKATTDKIELQDGSFDSTNVAGNTVAELDGRKNAVIEQFVEIDESGSFVFSIDHAARGKADAGSNAFEVHINDEVVAAVQNENSAFETFELALELTAGTNKIELIGVGASDGRGALIDNIVLSETYIEEYAY